MLDLVFLTINVDSDSGNTLVTVLIAGIYIYDFRYNSGELVLNHWYIYLIYSISSSPYRV